jgi:membrane dipeptidase
VRISERAAQLHRRAIIIDGHSDILLPVVRGVTALTEPWPASERARWETIAAQQTAHNSPNWSYTLDPMATLTAPSGQFELPLLEAGGVTALCASVYVPDDDLARAQEFGLRMVAALHRAIDSNPERCLLIQSVADIHRAKAEGKVGYILTMEGMEPIGRQLDLIDIYARLGLKMTTLTHSRRNALADGTQRGITMGGLTYLGRDALKRLAEFGIVVDLAHISDASFWDIIEAVDGPLLLSHTSLLTVDPLYRAAFDHVFPTYGMTKAQAIAAKGGLIGVVFWSQPNSETLVDELDALIAQIGSDHAGIGTDFYGFRQAPRDLQDSSELPRLTEAMVERGYDDETILKILGGNYLRIFEQVWR